MAYFLPEAACIRIQRTCTEGYGKILKNDVCGFIGYRIDSCRIKEDCRMKVIVINGPMGVGKTTVGKRIADQNPGTAFIDGDWCMDLHTFIGNQETKTMAVDNILHMIRNYQKCSACRMVVLVWLMDDPWVIQRIMEGLSVLQAETKSVTLVCDRENLIKRWKNDRDCDWRTDEWLNVSLKSLDGFASMDHAIDTSHLSADRIADLIMQYETVSVSGFH